MPASTNTGDSQKSRGGSRCPGLACAIVVLGVAMCARGEVPADAFGRELYYPDPEFCEIEEQKDRLWRDEQHLIWQETELCELKIKILQTLQIIDTFTGIPEPQIREELGRQVQQLKAQHEAVAKKVDWIASFGRMFEADKRHLAERDARYKDAVRFGNPSSVTSRRETWCRVHQCDHTKASQREADRIRHQNDLLEAQSLEWNRQTTLKKLEEMRGKLGRWEQATFSVLASGRLPPPPPAPLHDVEELKLCEALDKKVTAPNYDIAEINLLTAKGLPGAENLDVEKSLKTLDHWAAWVRRETDRNFHKFKDAPADYNNSESYFRILMMVCILQEDFKVCYNKDERMRAGPVELMSNDLSFFGNPKALFVHGLTEGEHQGTCASLPVFYVAIGRRLGYPLKLVESKGHLFARWEDSKERFNIEGTSRGLNCFPDKEYMEWPWPISKEEVDTGMYMKSLSPRRELAAFLEARALCLKQHKHEKQFLTAKVFADCLRRKEGVDLDKVNRLLRLSNQKACAMAFSGSNQVIQALASTNS
ncbi:MAG: hypothetical protein PHX41_08765 [Kiritimatiellae bacterium]|nr:hypothetical protein [Kiritimatiellia bacterium]